MINGNGKPFIIAAHSQGALLAHRLLNKRINNSQIQDRFICAYVIGYIIPEKFYDDIFPNIKKSENYDDTNCIISWSTVVEGFKRNREKTLFWKPDGWSIEPMKQRIISTNPFSWTNDDKWHSNEINKSIINKAQNYDFLDRFRKEHTGATLDDLDEKSLIKILQEPKNSLTKQYQELFKLDELRSTSHSRRFSNKLFEKHPYGCPSPPFKWRESNKSFIIETSCKKST